MTRKRRIRNDRHPNEIHEILQRRLRKTVIQSLSIVKLPKPNNINSSPNKLVHRNRCHNSFNQ